MKLLFENWRNYLNEAMKRPADLPEGLKVVIKPDDEFVRFEIVDEKTGERPTREAQLEKFGRLYGHVIIAPYGTDAKGYKCLDAWEVRKSDVREGFGPMLYDLAMEWATKNGGGLVADRHGVSEEAVSVWLRYKNSRDDVEKIQLDDLKNTLTPEDEDNCGQLSSHTLAYKRGGEWHQQPTAQLYKKTNSEMYDELRHAGKLYYDHTLDEDIDTRETFARELCDLGGYEQRQNPAGSFRKGDTSYQDIIDLGRPVKKLYNKYADRDFLNSLTTIHWTQRKGLVQILAHGSSKDELSCAAYLPGEAMVSTWGDYGVVVSGYISLLANDMNDVMSGAGKDYTEHNPERTKSSGANKGMGRTDPCHWYVDDLLVLDREDWNPRKRSGGDPRNEALVDNWKITAIISPEISHNFLRKIVHGKMGREDIKIMLPDQVGEL